MRFEYLVAAVVAGGLATGAAIQPLFSAATPTWSPAQAQAPTSVSFSLADLNPLRLIYDEVMKQVTSGDNRMDLVVGTPVRQPHFTDISRMNSQFNSEFDPARMARINGENAANQIREFNDRQQDMMNYARNPAGWHGAPPN
jgi:hypothetical protein